MAIYFITDTPQKLLTALKKAIDEEHIKTWSYNENGNFTHTTSSGQWENKAWLKPYIEDGKLKMLIIPPLSGKVTQEIYGVYQGRFLESLTVHCKDFFITARSTAKPTIEDKLRGSKYVGS